VTGGKEVTFGEFIAKLRTRKGWYQRDLAAEAGRSEEWVSGIERGLIPSSTRPPPPSRLPAGRPWAAPSTPTATASCGASAGWLLEHIGCRPGHWLADGVRCSQRRTLTLTVHDGATAAALHAVLGKLAQDVHEATGIELAAEPVAVGA
jgi:UDP-N-acetylenolpyruvoylglucosamine reductase